MNDFFIVVGKIAVAITVLSLLAWGRKLALAFIRKYNR